MSKKNKLNRRQFINKVGASSLLAMGPIELFTHNILNGTSLFMDNAHGAISESPMHYVNLYMGGGPSRRFFDCPLKVKGQPFIHNSRFCNKITDYDIANIKDTYETIEHKNILLPYLAQVKVPTPSGEWVPLQNLFDNIMIIRGVELPFDGHNNCAKLVTDPPGAAETLQARAASVSPYPFGCIDYETSSRLNYRSQKGIALTRLSRTDPVLSLLALLRGYENRLSYGSQDLEQSIQNAIEIYAEEASKNNPKLKSLYSQKKTAKEMVKRNISALLADYDQTLQKYKNLISLTLRSPASLPGVFDTFRTKKDINDQIENERFRLSQSYQYKNLTLNEMIVAETHNDRLAFSMAITEICLKNKLSNSITGGAGTLAKLQLQKTGQDETSFFNLTHDSHYIGCYSLLYLQSMYFYGIGACFTELKRTLQSISIGDGKNMFDKTVIQLSSEFNGNPGYSGTGHFWRGQSTSFISGKIKSPDVIGNIYLDNGRNGQKGTDGRAAPVAELGERKLGPGNLVSTACELLEVDSVVPNDPSVASVDGAGKIISKIGKAKNV